jgi:transposase
MGRLSFAARAVRVSTAQSRRDRLTGQIAAMVPEWTLAPIVAALQAMRGMALVNAATLIAELGDLPRFANLRQLMAYLGLVPSEHSSGASVRRGGLTKVGNSAARRLLKWCRRNTHRRAISLACYRAAFL